MFLIVVLNTYFGHFEEEVILNSMYDVHYKMLQINYR